jgi:hypothetical protein
MMARDNTEEALKNIVFGDALAKKRAQQEALREQGTWEQEGDGGITVSAMSNGTVRLTDREGGYAVEFPPLTALDVGQRMIAMAALHMKQAVLAAQPVQAKPRIDIVKQGLPKP